MQTVENPTNSQAFATSKERYSITLCICTMNRPHDLTKCLESVSQCSTQPAEIIVSDDSHEPEPTKAVVERYPSITYQTGPRTGLGPNRNACIRAAHGTHLMFIDDDVCVPSDFFTTAQALIQANPDSIITGHEIKHRSWEESKQKVIPKNADFWGIMRLPINADDCCSVVMNSAIFPATLFKQALFDECLRYGYEELDIARHAVALGYRIVHRDALWVDHYQSLVDRESNWKLKFASQMYTTAKAYFYYEGSLLKTLGYAVLAPLKVTGSLVKRKDPKALKKGIDSTISAYQHFFSKKEKGLLKLKKTNC
ncbi:MAG: glycosyltransferase family A protein [Cyanobacteria bacterium J06623_5]